MSINKAVFTGNLTRDAELRATRGGSSVLAFTVAVNDRRRQGDEWVDVANFIDCAVFGRRADALAPHLRKGVKVAVEGKLRYSAWEADDGTRRSKVSVAVEDIDFTGGRRDGGQQSQAADARQAVQAAYPGANVYEDDDIPF